MNCTFILTNLQFIFCCPWFSLLQNRIVCWFLGWTGAAASLNPEYTTSKQCRQNNQSFLPYFRAFQAILLMPLCNYFTQLHSLTFNSFFLFVCLDLFTCSKMFSNETGFEQWCPHCPVVLRADVQMESTDPFVECKHLNGARLMSSLTDCQAPLSLTVAGLCCFLLRLWSHAELGVRIRGRGGAFPEKTNVDSGGAEVTESFFCTHHVIPCCPSFLFFLLCIIGSLLISMNYSVWQKYTTK